MSRVSIIPGLSVLFWSNSMTVDEAQWLCWLMLTTMGSSKRLSRTSEWGWFIFTKKKATELSQCFKLPISTVWNIIRKWKRNGAVKVNARSGRPRKISDRMAWDLVRNAQKNKNNTSTAKELQKRVANAGLRASNNKALHRVARKNDRNTKWSIWSTQKITLRSL